VPLAAPVRLQNSRLDPARGMAVCLDVKSYAMARDDKGKEYAVSLIGVGRFPGSPQVAEAQKPCSTWSFHSSQVFVVSIRLGSYFWTVYRRYNQFKSLCDQVCAVTPGETSRKRVDLHRETLLAEWVLACPCRS
jgi:hypothetical protein